MASHIDCYIHIAHIHQESRVDSCSLHPSILTATANKAHVVDSRAHVQLQPKGHLLLATTIRVIHVRPFC